MIYNYSNLPKLPCTSSNLPGPTLPVCTPYTPAQGPYVINPCHNHFDMCHNYHDTCHNPYDGFGFFC